MKAIIIDDEPDAVEALHLNLLMHCPQVAVISKCTKSPEGLIAIRTLQPDLVFLDIEMPVMNGFQILEALDEIRFNLIFTTAYDQYAVRAFRYSALDFLLKPVDPDELKAAVEKASGKLRTEKMQIDLLRKQLYEPGSKFQNRIALPYQQGYTIVDILRHR